MKTSNQLLFFLLFFFLYHTSKSQELISAGGNSHQSGNMQITWSLGELMTETFSSTTNLLTQGFNQPQLTVTNVPVNEITDFTVLLYPNPTNGFISIQIDDTRNDEFRIYAIDGRLLATEEISGNITTVDFQQFESGIYLVKILRDHSHIKTFQIIKN